LLPNASEHAVVGQGTRLAFRLVPVTRVLLPPRRSALGLVRARGLASRGLGSRSRGFTLTEVLAVMALISVLVVTASPTFIRLMRDRRVNRAAMHLVDYYRTGRTRAMGRGQPMLVVWDPNSGISNSEPGARGLVRLVEPIVSTSGLATTCASTAWNTATTQEVSRVDFKSGAYTNTVATFKDDTSAQAAQTYAEMCFSPTGRAYVRFNSSDVFRPMQGYASFTVANADTGSTRQVYIPPNGVARMQL
jgi:type IV fimbrial biogenesis protein FimT